MSKYFILDRLFPGDILMFVNSVPQLCLLCLHSRRRSSAKPRLARTESVVTSTSGHSLGSQPPGPGLHTLYYDQLTYRSATSILPLPLLTSIFADPWLPPSPTPE